MTESKLWKPVTLAFNLPATATSASTQFRLYYEKLLLAYEDRCAPPALAFRSRCVAVAADAFCASLRVRSYFQGQMMRGVSRRLGTGWHDAGGGAGESGGSGGSNARPLKRSASDAGVTSPRQTQKKEKAAANKAPAPAVTLNTPGGALPPPPWTQGLTPTQQAAALLAQLQPSPGPYIVVPPDFETECMQRLRMALFGGVRSEITWALNALAVLSYDARPGNELRVTAMPGLLDVLVACLSRAAEAPDAAAGALALAASLPRRPGPDVGGMQDADMERAAKALQASVALGVLPSPLSDDAVATAAAAAAAACIMRNISFCKANVPALLAAGKPVAQAAHLLRVEAQGNFMVCAEPQDADEQWPEHSSGRSLDDDAAAAERGSMCGDLLDMLINLAHAVQLAPAAAQPGGAGGGAGSSSGVDHKPVRFALATHMALQNAAPRRAACGAELICRLCTPANVAGFRAGGAFADTGALLPPLLQLLSARDADSSAASLAAAALARLAEVREYSEALAAEPDAADVLVATALDARMPELAHRNALATLNCMLQLPAPPRPPVLLRCEQALSELAASGKEEVSRLAARVLRSPIFNTGVFQYL